MAFDNGHNVKHPGCRICEKQVSDWHRTDENMRWAAIPADPPVRSYADGSTDPYVCVVCDDDHSAGDRDEDDDEDGEPTPQTKALFG